MRPPLFLAFPVLAAALGFAPSTLAQEAVTGTAHLELVDAVLRLASEDPLEAAAAAVRLEAAGEAAVPYLIEAIDRKNWELRRRAADLLGRAGDPRAIPALGLAMRRGARDDERTQLAAAIALARLGDASGIPALIDLLEHGSRPVRLRASIALRRFTHLSFDYRFDAPRPARASAVQRWRLWWQANERTFRIAR